MRARLTTGAAGLVRTDEDGHAVVSPDMLTDALWKEKPFTIAQALIDMALWGEVGVAGLSEAWGWPGEKVKQFLDDFQSRGMVTLVLEREDMDAAKNAPEDAERKREVTYSMADALAGKFVAATGRPEGARVFIAADFFGQMEDSLDFDMGELLAAIENAGPGASVADLFQQAHGLATV